MNLIGLLFCSIVRPSYWARNSCQRMSEVMLPNGGERVYFARMMWGNLLLRGVVSERNTLLDVALQALDSGLQECLLLVGDIGEDIDGLLGTVGLIVVSSLHKLKAVGEAAYSELDGNREKVHASNLSDLLAAGNTGEVNVGGLNKTLGSLGSLEELLGKSRGTSLASIETRHCLRRSHL